MHAGTGARISPPPSPNSSRLVRSKNPGAVSRGFCVPAPPLEVQPVTPLLRRVVQFLQPEPAAPPHAADPARRVGPRRRDLDALDRTDFPPDERTLVALPKDDDHRVLDDWRAERHPFHAVDRERVVARMPA